MVTLCQPVDERCRVGTHSYPSAARVLKPFVRDALWVPVRVAPSNGDGVQTVIANGKS